MYAALIGNRHSYPTKPFRTIKKSCFTVTPTGTGSKTM